jgi:hypothetical protein
MKKYLNLLKEEVPMPTKGEFLPVTKPTPTYFFRDEDEEIIETNPKTICVITIKAKNLFHSLDPKSINMYHKEAASIFGKMGDSYCKVANKEDIQLLQQYWTKVRDCIHMDMCKPDDILKNIDEAIESVMKHFSKG